MDEVNKYWRTKREQQRQRRKERVQKHESLSQIEMLIQDGFFVEQLGDVHYRINKRLDVWLLHYTYHDIVEDVRGEFGYGKRDLYNFVIKYLVTNDKRHKGIS